jgi:hypothetical protein
MANLLPVAFLFFGGLEMMEIPPFLDVFKRLRFTFTTSAPTRIENAAAMCASRHLSSYPAVFAITKIAKK